MEATTPRVRFAPSPTGYLHIGGLRTALYNYLFAKNTNGKIILRIEDTDRKRFVEGAVENLLNTLNWVGLEFDEGPEKDGGHGPYFQSERLDIYKAYAEKLIQEGKAYYCFCSPERLNELREEQQKQKVPQSMYDKHCLHLSKEKIKDNLNAGISKIVRLNVEPGQKIVFNDVIRDTVEFESSNIDDQVIIKSDGYPTYHLANVVDDHNMGITHVIRGEEWLSSTPKHILLYEYFEWGKPVFAHLPLLLNADKSKLSKRQGDVAVEDYRDKGYLKEALLNFVAFLGWNPGDESELLSLNELIHKFSLGRVHKAGAVFNLEKLTWLNEEHLRKKDSKEILTKVREELSKSEYKEKSFSDDFLLDVIEAMKPRVSFYSEFISKCTYFYTEPLDYDDGVIKKRWKVETPEQLSKLRDRISLLDNPTKDNFELALTETAELLQIGKGKLIHPVRLAVSGTGTGPGVYDLLYILGKDECVKRINRALNSIKL
jgi:glutamyl-tRNA synthetase